jgi:hypothetical protein
MRGGGAERTAHETTHKRNEKPEVAVVVVQVQDGEAEEMRRDAAFFGILT